MPLFNNSLGIDPGNAAKNNWMAANFDSIRHRTEHQIDADASACRSLRSRRHHGVAKRSVRWPTFQADAVPPIW